MVKSIWLCSVPPKLFPKLKSGFVSGHLRDPVQPWQHRGLVQHPVPHGAGQPDEADVRAYQTDRHHHHVGLLVSEPLP